MAFVIQLLSYISFLSVVINFICSTVTFELLKLLSFQESLYVYFSYNFDYYFSSICFHFFKEIQ